MLQFSSFGQGNLEIAANESVDNSLNCRIYLMRKPLDLRISIFRHPLHACDHLSYAYFKKSKTQKEIKLGNNFNIYRCFFYPEKCLNSSLKFPNLPYLIKVLCHEAQSFFYTK